jgi:hypothetical protein
VARLTDRERAKLPDRVFAYVDASGKRRLPIHDEAHMRNALAMFSQVRLESDNDRDRARQRLLEAAKKHGIMPVGFVTSQLRAQRSVPRLPTGAVTFLLTDIEASTALLRRLGASYSGLLHEVRRLIDESVTRASGHKVDAHGDEYFGVTVRRSTRSDHSARASLVGDHALAQDDVAVGPGLPGADDEIGSRRDVVKVLSREKLDVCISCSCRRHELALHRQPGAVGRAHQVQRRAVVQRNDRAHGRQEIRRRNTRKRQQPAGQPARWEVGVGKHDRVGVTHGVKVR